MAGARALTINDSSICCSDCAHRSPGACCPCPGVTWASSSPDTGLKHVGCRALPHLLTPGGQSVFVLVTPPSHSLRSLPLLAPTSRSLAGCSPDPLHLQRTVSRASDPSQAERDSGRTFLSCTARTGLPCGLGASGEHWDLRRSCRRTSKPRPLCAGGGNQAHCGGLLKGFLARRPRVASAESHSADTPSRKAVADKGGAQSKCQPLGRPPAGHPHGSLGSDTCERTGMEWERLPRGA